MQLKIENLSGYVYLFEIINERGLRLFLQLM